jgi:hypothetical protein
VHALRVSHGKIDFVQTPSCNFTAQITICCGKLQNYKMAFLHGRARRFTAKNGGSYLFTIGIAKGH